ncbi:hypothetical protein CYMTET_9909 [Cymbomonas tetramitiformis]|uniref:Uncharacterized protein n=1 Tax=Cymbomonas tetramitiformis TaxID=36881 RepID=A0AAE0GRT1_9CHLO|nr:hypothetical protein CYMTET_9909 [Cymbomonas tetramitiformis]
MKAVAEDSDLDASIRLLDAVRDTPTVRTPHVVPPAAASKDADDIALRRYLVDQHANVDAIYKGRLHRAWANGIREDILGSKKHHYRGTHDTDRLSELVVQRRIEFESAGLDLTPFDLDDPTSLVIEKVNGLLYDVLALVVERNFTADSWLHGRPLTRSPSWLVSNVWCGITALLTGSPPTRPASSHCTCNCLDPVFYAAVKVSYPLVSDLGAIPLRSLQALVVAIYQAWAQSDDGAAVREKQALGTDDRPSTLITSSEYAVLLDEIAALKALVQGNRAGAGQRQQLQQQQRGKQHPRGHRVGVHAAPPVGFDMDHMKAKPLRHRCRKAGKGDAYHPYRDCPLGGRQHSSATAAAFCIPIEAEDAEGLHTLALVQAAQEKTHFTHAYFIPGSGVEEQASALVCGPAAAAGIMPEEPRFRQVVVRRHRHRSAVPAPAMPVSQQVDDVAPAPPQSARVTTTAATGGEFEGFVHTVNHAAVQPSDLTGYCKVVRSTETRMNHSYGIL